MAREFDIQLDTIDGFGDGGDFGQGEGSFTGSGGASNVQGNVLETAAPTPVVNPVDVSGGLTPQQVDQLATQFETEEGGTLAVAFGEHLIAGTMVAHDYDGVTPENQFFIGLGEGWGGLGGRGEWESVVKAYWSGEELTNRYSFTTWVEDTTPAGAVLFPDLDGWNWISKDPAPFFGKYCHQSPLITGAHSHFFQDATETLSVGTGDVLFCWVYLDPTNPPQEVMLQFRTGTSFEHRAYWGANLINAGTNGTDSRRQISASIPATGQWVRLDVLASQVGLEGTTLNGMSFTAFDGRITWDQAGRWTANSSAGFRFLPGYLSPNQDDVQQGGSATNPQGTNISGTAGIFVKLTAAQSAEDRPDKFRARVRCRRVFNYAPTGEPDAYDYNISPGRVAADRILAFFQRIHRKDLALAQEKFRARVDWQSWRVWSDFCQELIPWQKNSTTTEFIFRFACHIAFVADLTLADALDQICATSATWWQDDGEQLIFLPPIDRDPVHHFDESNITGPPRISVIDLRERPNFFIAKYREFDDEFLGEVTSSVKREASIARVGEIKSQRAFTTMPQSQAQRLLARQARLEHDNPVFATLTGDATSIHVLPGDFVTVSHPVPNWVHQVCLVVDITVRSSEDSPDEVEFTLQRIDGELYSDTDHTPIQEALTLP